jgi:putative transcriptional regulator
MRAKDFGALLKSIDEARAIRAGTRKPSRVIRFSPIQVKVIRKRLRVSQTQFAHLIGVSAATLRNWEQGRTYPEGAARALLKVAAHRPEAVLSALRG